MGISVKVIMATDEQMNAFQSQSATELESAIVSAEDECYLADHRDALHYLLTKVGRRNRAQRGG